MLIPYRVKNPWKRFPYATISIIALNVLVYLLTTESFLQIREDVVVNYAFQFGVSPFLTIFTAMFLHGDLFHIGGNMLFFWVFAPPVEDRLGIPRFLAVYFLTGITGDLLQSIIDVSVHGGTYPSIGASGCIMGIMGAYWFLFSWSKVCIFYWFGWFFRGVAEIAAFWVIGFYLVMDIAEGYFTHGGNGVANFAHVGGSVSGALLCLAMRMKRDSAELSEAKATQAEVKDLSLLSLSELEVMRKADPQNPEILRAMLRPAVSLGKVDALYRAYQEAGPALIDKAPDLVLVYLLRMQGDYSLYTPAQLIRLARHAEETPNPQQALAIYQVIREHYPQAMENEMALYRTALCYKDKLRDHVNARASLQELVARYPFGTLEPYARVLMKELGG